jgi:uncharacterized membrane protein
MDKLKKASRIAWCIGIAGMVAPQAFYKQFGNNFFPAWPGLAGIAFWAFLFTIAVIVSCIFIILEKRGRMAALLLGVLLFVMYLFGNVPFELMIDPYNNHLGSWANGLKELALAGGAFIIAGSFPKVTDAAEASLLRTLEKLIPVGRIFFSIMIVLYGYSHFLYAKFIAPLVPGWIPGHIFCTYFAGVALMAAGLAIIFRIKLKLTAMLLGAMILIWLLILHTPLAIADPFGNNSNSLISAFSALAFSATAFLIVSTATNKRTNSEI